MTGGCLPLPDVNDSVCPPSPRWEIEGAVFGMQCGEVESAMSLVFLGEGQRRACTPYLDATSYGNLRLHFTMGKWVPVARACTDPSVTLLLTGFASSTCHDAGGGQCDPGESHDHDVILFGQLEGEREHVVLDTLPYSSYRVGCTFLAEFPTALPAFLAVSIPHT